MGEREQFVAELATAIVHAGGAAVFDAPKAEKLATKVLERLYEIGPFAYPSLLDEEGLRFVYQWDENPPLITVMLWVERMWQDMERVPVPRSIDEDINR